MAYFLYHRTNEEGRWRLILQSAVSLYGCHAGVVANALRNQVPDGQQQPWSWHVSIPDALRQYNSTGDVFVIDLKPTQRRRNNEFSFYELLDVWGYSYPDWTPALLRLRSLLIDHKDNDLDCNDFTINPEEVDEPIFTFTSFAGGIENGQLLGTWNPPGPSSTNSALLWPDALDYFIHIIRHYLPPAR